MSALILFDYDGVLVDSIEIFSEAVNVAGRELNQPVSFVADDLRRIKHMSIREIVAVAGIDPVLSQAFVDGIDRELYRRFDDMPLFPEIDNVVRQLRKLGTVGIVSATSRAVITKVMQKHALLENFAHITGGDMPGTKAEKIIRIVQKYGSPETRTCMIGDTVSDLEQGRAAGVRTIAVSWGWHSIEKLRKYEPDYEAYQPKELVEIVKSHF